MPSITYVLNKGMEGLATYPAADCSIDNIGDLLALDIGTLLACASSPLLPPRP